MKTSPDFRLIACMNIAVNKKSVEKFKDKMDRLGITIPAYQTLEAVFRQTLMMSKTSKYHYADEHPDTSLCREASLPEKRLSSIERHIDEWERRKNLEYGFTLVNINEIDPHITMVHEFHSAIEELKSVVERHKDVLDSRWTNDHIDILRVKLKNQLRFNGRPPGRYFDEESMSLKVENFDYFSRYLGFAYGTFGAFFNKLVEIGDETRPNFTRFLAAKLNFECENNEHIKVRFTVSMLADRLRGNKKGYEALSEEPSRLGLVDNAFIEYLALQNRSWGADFQNKGWRRQM